MKRPSSWVFGLAAIFTVSLLLRAAHEWAIAVSPIGGVLVQDARFYHEEALRILGLLPRSLGASVPFMNFGYPWILAAIYRVAGAAPNVVVGLQAIADSVAAVLLALAVRELTQRDAPAIVAGFFYAAYAPAIFYSALLLTPAPTNACLALALYATARVTGGRGGNLAAVVAGLALGFAVLIRANVILLVPAFAAVTGAALRGRRGWCTATVLAVSALAAPVAVTVALGVAHGEWVPVTANGGMNFWVGNNRDSDGVYFAAPFLGNRGAEGEERAYLVEAQRRTGNSALTLAGASSFWLREGIHEIAADPARWARLIVRKAFWALSGFEAKTNVSMSYVANFSPVLRWTPVRWIWLAPLGAAGLIVLGRRSPAAWLLFFLAAIPLVTCVAFFVSGEYRHPAALAWAAAAGNAVCSTPKLAASVRRARLAAIVAAVVLVIAVWPQPALGRAFHPSADVRSFVRSLGVPRLDGSLPTRDDLERAARILAAAPAANRPDLVYLDTTMWLAWRTAALADDPREAEAALDAGKAIRSYRPVPGDLLFTEDMREGLRDVVAARVRDLAALRVVRADPALTRRAALAGANDWLEIPSEIARGNRDGARAFAAAALEEAPGEARLIALAETVSVTIPPVAQ